MLACGTLMYWFCLLCSDIIVGTYIHIHNHTSVYTCTHKRLKYEPSTGEYVNSDGVETRVPDFGGTSSIEYLDPDTKFSDTTNYFHDMVQWFVDKGYTRGKDIVGAPYDWRHSPSESHILCSNYKNILYQCIN